MPKYKKTVIMLTAMVVVMLAFSFALVPFYDIACRVLGISQVKQTTPNAAMTSDDIDLSRNIKVEMDVSLNHLPVSVVADQRELFVFPGDMIKTTFYATNLDTKPIIVQAVPSITPGGAAKYFNKIECFCFTQQKLAPGEKKQMPLVFYVDPALPEKYKIITLSYAFFEKPVAQETRGQLDGI